MGLNRIKLTEPQKKSHNPKQPTRTLTGKLRIKPKPENVSTIPEFF
jgi:hypothetical protein